MINVTSHLYCGGLIRIWDQRCWTNWMLGASTVGHLHIYILLSSSGNIMSHLWTGRQRKFGNTDPMLAEGRFKSCFPTRCHLTIFVPPPHLCIGYFFNSNRVVQFSGFKISIKEIDQGCFEVGEEEGSFPWKVLSVVIGEQLIGDWWLVIGDWWLGARKRF